MPIGHVEQGSTTSYALILDSCHQFLNCFEGSYHFEKERDIGVVGEM